MLDPRIYRAALVPVLLAAIICAFSLRDRPAPITTTLAPDAFSASRTAGQLADLADAFPVRRAGDAADRALARRVAAEFRGMGPYEVTTRQFTGRTIDGRRGLTTVLARQVGAPGPELVVVAHRDAAGRGSEAELSGTAVMLELARVVAGGRLRRSVTFVSTSGGSGGAAGARDLVGRLGASGGPIDAILVLGDMASGTSRSFAVNWSESSSLGPARLQRTIERAVQDEAGRRPHGPSSFTQWTRIAFPGALGEQGPLIGAGLPAVLMSASGERPPRAGAEIVTTRLAGFGRAALRSLVALDEGPDLRAEPARDVVALGKVLPEWAARLFIGALLLAPVLATIDGFARVRRRHQPVGRWLGWIAAAAAPVVIAAAFASLLGLTGLLTAPAGPVPGGAIPVDGAARAALVATVLVAVLGAFLRPVLLRAAGGSRGFDGPGAGAALLVAWCALAVVLWIVNPFAAAFMAPAAHLWLLVAEPNVRLRRAASLAVVALSLLPFVFAGVVLARQFGLGPLDFAWAVVVWVAGAHVGPLAWLFWSCAAGCAAGAVVLAWRSRPPERVTPARVTVRGPITYAGPGSLGGTESALRR
jgi:hypothetical protein